MDKLFRVLIWIGILSVMAQGKFKTLNCQCHDQALGNFSKCEIKAVNRTKNLINVVFDFYQTVTKNVEVHIGFFKRANGWHPFLYSFSIDACKYFDKPYNVIALIAFDYLKPYSNMNHTCPYLAGSSIIVKDFDLNIDQFRSRFPIANGEYALRLSITLNKVLKATVNGSIYYFDYKDQ